MLLQTLITRPITLTMRIQNWNNSEYVTIIAAPLSKCRRAQKDVFPPQMRRGAARLPLLGHAQLSTTMDIYTDILDNTIDDAAAKMGGSF